ncbi:MAG: acyl-CoA dehydrogenase family protein [Pontixanthobacter sp.]
MEDGLDMGELLDPFVKMLEACCPPETVKQIEGGGDYAALWDAVEQSGYLQSLVPEDCGGFGLGLAEVSPLLMAIGAQTVPLPLGETMIARALVAGSPAAEVAGPIALVCADAAGPSLVPYGLVCDLVLADVGSELLLFDIRTMPRGLTGVYGSIDAWIDLGEVGFGQTVTRPANGLRSLAALNCAAAISGAAEAVLNMTVTYANERVQFGKPIGRQQALQQQLAVMAEDVVAVRLAVQLACQGAFPPAEIPAASAKAIASAAAARIAATAHGLFGAIGISEEHHLQRYSRRLHAWRQAFGSEQFWQMKIGDARLQSGQRSVDWVRETFQV